MSGWIALATLIAAALASLAMLKVRGPMLQLAAASLLIGAAGYALDGHPGLQGASTSEAHSRAPIPLRTLRHAFFGRFGPTEHWSVISESYASRGETEDAAKAMQAAVKAHPGDPTLWVGLGNALADHSGGLTPASELAYRRAMELAPGYPGPRFFYGLALARSGDPQRAVAIWRQILAEAPAEASWRPFVEDSIRAVEPPPKVQAATGS